MWRAMTETLNLKCYDLSRAQGTESVMIQELGVVSGGYRAYGVESLRKVLGCLITLSFLGNEYIIICQL